jgi:ParB/RepB/Spo0J family partition protein
MHPTPSRTRRNLLDTEFITMAQPLFKLVEIALAAAVVKTNRHSPKFIASLAHSLDEHGLLHPPIGVSNGDRVEIIAGVGRVLAAKHLSWQRIKVFLASDLDQATQLILAVAENTLRERMTVPDLADKIAEVEAVTGWPVSTIVKHWNISPSIASRAQTAMASVAPDARPILEGAPMFVWFEVTKLPHAQQASVAERCLAEKWTRDQLQRFVREQQLPSEKPRRHAIELLVSEGYEGAKRRIKALLAQMNAFEKQDIGFEEALRLL